MIDIFERMRSTLTLRKRIMLIALLLAVIVSSIVLLFQEYARTQETLPSFEEAELMPSSNFTISHVPSNLDEVAKIIKEEKNLDREVTFFFFRKEDLCSNELGFWFRAERNFYLYCHPNTFYEFVLKKEKRVGIIDALMKGWEIFTNFTKS